MSPLNVARRAALTGSAALGLGSALAACASDDKAVDPAVTTDPSAETSAGNAAPADAPAPASAEAIATTDQIAVGACTVFGDSKLVVTQPAEGSFKCFTSVCPHAGCEVSSSSEGFIPCACHGSEFSLTDGSVMRGPATSGLAEVAINVKDGEIHRA